MARRMRPYPEVIGELETLKAVVAGNSLARYGDGEFKMAKYVTGIKSQEAHEGLTERLREILHDSGECLVGIPNIWSDTPKTEHWGKYVWASRMLSERRQYHSSFVTRPDSAPWIDTDEYWELLESLWVGQEVTLVRGSGKSFTADRLMEAGAGQVTEILAPKQHAWASYNQLLKRIGTPKRAILCLGPTATVMAVDLCAKGVHAIDLGHMGMFWKKHVLGLPLWVTEEDKKQEPVAQ